MGYTYRMKCFEFEVLMLVAVLCCTVQGTATETIDAETSTEPTKCDDNDTECHLIQELMGESILHR